MCIKYLSDCNKSSTETNYTRNRIVLDRSIVLQNILLS